MKNWRKNAICCKKWTPLNITDLLCAPRVSGAWGTFHERPSQERLPVYTLAQFLYIRPPTPLYASSHTWPTSLSLYLGQFRGHAERRVPERNTRRNSHSEGWIHRILDCDFFFLSRSWNPSKDVVACFFGGVLVTTLVIRSSVSGSISARNIRIFRYLPSEATSNWNSDLRHIQDSCY